MLDVVDHHQTQLGRSEYGDFGSVAEELLHKVGGEPQVIVENGILVMDHLLLGVMERQCAEIFCLSGINSDCYLTHFAMGENNAERVAEISFSIEVGRHLERVLQDAELMRSRA